MPSARHITKALGGRWHGSYGMAPCPAHDDGQTPGLKVSSHSDTADDIIVHCFAGCDWRDVKAELRRRGLLPEWEPVGRGGAGRNLVKISTRLPNTPVPAPARDNNPNRERALAMWREATPAAGSVVEHYLQARGITIPVPESIRHAHLRHAPTGLSFPTMVCVVQGPDRRIVAIHRTYLTTSGAAKAGVSSPRMMLGRCTGGAVHLAPVGRTLVVGEGIESTMSVQQAIGLPGWSALSTSGLIALRLPDLPLAETVIIAADHDDPGLEAAEKAAARWQAEGRTVRIAKPPVKNWDFNDVLLAPETVAFLPERRHG